MTNKQRTWGQFATPTDVADLILGFCLRRPENRLLDPSCGDGALLKRAAQWQSWLAADGMGLAPDTLYGVELDAESAGGGEIPGVTLIRSNFFALDPAVFPAFDAVVGNPPYTRAEWIGRLDSDAEAQLPLFSEVERPVQVDGHQPLLPHHLRVALSRRAGLYTHFFLHGFHFLREGGRLGFVVPNGWLDVAYGRELKQFLLDHFRILAVIESTVERWFGKTGVNTCIIILERTGDPEARAANRVRFASLHQPLRHLLDADADDSRRPAAVEQFISRLLPPADRRTGSLSVRVYGQGTLEPAARWGMLRRAPEIHRQSAHNLGPLNRWAKVQRGYTTGANDYFYLDQTRLDDWVIEPEYHRPLLKSLRGVHSLRLDRSACTSECLTIPLEARLNGTGAAAYLAWGIEQGIHRRRTCAGRQPWYALGKQPPAPIFLAKGVWQRHFAPLAAEPITVDQQIYRLFLTPGIDPEVAAALLNSAWFALQCEMSGRVNLGEGVLWLATYELGEVELPNPRSLDSGLATRLVQAFRQLAERPVVETIADLNRLDRWSLDELVFDWIGLVPAERETVRQALIECLTVRRERAMSGSLE